MWPTSSSTGEDNDGLGMVLHHDTDTALTVVTQLNNFHRQFIMA
jgi:hypothetical protein